MFKLCLIYVYQDYLKTEKTYIDLLGAVCYNKSRQVGEATHSKRYKGAYNERN